jgi:hypothetical protein
VFSEGQREPIDVASPFIHAGSSVLAMLALAASCIDSEVDAPSAQATGQLRPLTHPPRLFSTCSGPFHMDSAFVPWRT